MFDFEDPRKLAFLMAASGLLTPQSRQMGRGAQVMNSIGQGLEGFARGGILGSQNKRRSELTDIQKQMAQMQLDESKLQRDFDRAAFKPGVGAQPLTPFDDEGNRMPSPDATFDFEAAQKVSPRLAFDMQQKLKKQETPIILPKDAMALDPNTLLPFLSNRAPQEQFIPLTPAEAAAAGIPKGQAAQKSSLTGKISAIGTMPQSTNINMPPQEKAEGAARGAMLVKNYENIAALRENALKQNALLDAVLRNPLDTNAATPITSTAKAWLLAAGVPSNKIEKEVGNFQAFKAAASELVLQKQLAQKGPQTESDARRLEQTVANPAYTNDANKIITTFAKEMNNRDIEKAAFFDKWYRKEKTYDGAEEAWQAGPGGISLWERPSLKKYRGAEVSVSNW